MAVRRADFSSSRIIFALTDCVRSIAACSPACKFSMLVVAATRPALASIQDGRPNDQFETIWSVSS